MSSDLHFLQGKNLKDANIAVSAGKIYLDTATNELWYDDPSGDITDKHIRLFNNATKTTDGLMSAEDKRKVNYTNVSYGTCTTAANIANKVVSFSTDENEWSLTVGAMITVLFSYTNTANNPTLNVNGTGAKAIYYNTTKITTSSLSYGGYANRLITYIYDGTYYRFVSWGTDANTKNTAGATNNVTNKLFLIGAKEQTTNPQTYTNVNTYVSENHLFSNDSQVLNQSELVSTTKSTIASNTASTTSGRTYPIGYDKNGKLSVNIPWTNTWLANTATQAGYVAAPGANVANKVWKTDSTGTPGWRDDADTNTDTWQANTVTQDGYVTAPTTSNANKVWKTDANGNPGWRTDSNTWTPNTASNAGYVAAGTGNANKVWKTDADGVPGWRADADTNTKNTAGTYNKADTKLFIVGSTAQSTSSSGSSATNTNSSVYVGTDNNLYDSRGLVASAASISSLSSAMIFRGTVGTSGTVTTLPTASSATEGDTYKVITAGTYASQVAKIGDVFVCCKPTGATAYEWILIPSGDEPSGTVTSIATADGITGGTITSSGTLKANLVSYTKNDAAATSSSSDKLYAVQLDKDGKLAIAMEAADKADMATYAKYIRMTSTNPSTATTYNIPFVAGVTANTNYEPRGNNGLRYKTVEGTTSAEGYSRLYLGNSTATGTAGNKSGGILIYSSGASYQLLMAHPSAANGSTAASSHTTYLRDYGATGYLVATTTRNAVGSTTQPVYISTSGVATAGSTYAGGTKVTLNATDKGAATASFYAPTSAGIASQILVSTGGAPQWNTTIPNAALPLRLRSAQSSGLDDANAATETGFYYMTTAATNRPDFSQSSNKDYRILTTAYSDSWLQQIATDFRCNDIFYRRRENGTWKNWIQLLTSEGGTLNGLLKAHGGIALNDSTAQSNGLTYILGIKAFDEGGNIVWSSATDVSVKYATSAGSAVKATQDSNGNAIVSTYLPLAGGTMNAEKAINFIINRKNASGGGWAYDPLCVMGQDKNVFARIGVYGQDDALNWMYIGSHSYDSTLNLRIGPDGNVYATKFVGPLDGNASSATYATNALKDGDGNTISTTYAKLASVNNMVHSGNEWTVVPSEYSGALWLNWQTCGGKNGNITQYNFGNGKGGTTGVTLVADAFTGNASSATKLATARTLSISGTAGGTAPTFDGTANVTLSIPKNISSFNRLSFTTTDNGTSPTAQSIVLNGVENSTDTAKAPGIGFHIGGKNWGSLKFLSDGSFRFYNNECNGYKAVYASTFYGNLSGKATTAGTADNATSATSASKLTTDAGSTLTPVYFSGGVPKACTMITNGAWHGGLTSIGGDGVMEVGKYIDFHAEKTGTSDYDVRITAATTGLTISGTTSGTFKGNLEGNATSATSAGKISDITENDKASSSATKRRIWFCYDNNTTGRPAYDDRFTIQTSTGTLFAPTFSGNLSGNATTATTAAYANKININGISNDTKYGTYGGIIQDSSTGPNSGAWHNTIKILHNNSAGYYTSIATQFTGEDGLWFRSYRNGADQGWKRVAVQNMDNTFSGTNNFTTTKTEQSYGHHTAATYTTTASNSGYYKIKINSANNWMTAFTIRVYQSYKWSDIVISGYNYGNSYWYSPVATMLGSSDANAITVYFGYDSAYNLWVGIPASSYTGIDIIDVTNGYVAFDSYKDLFTISNVSSLGGTTQVTTTVYRPWYRNERVSESTTCEYPAGFASRTVGATWGNTTGTSITSWNDATGGSVDWRRDNPSSGKISMKVDGRVYVNEGTNPVLSSEHANGYWGICTPDGANNEWIRTTQNGIIPYAAGGHGSIGTSSWPFNEGHFRYLSVIHDTCNNGTDALAYFRHYSNNDWTVKVDSGSYDYGLHVANAHTATNALSVNGGARISNTLRLGNGTALDGNYCEGLRIRAADGQWTTIIMGATSDTGTNTNAWSIHRKSDNNFCISRNSSDGANGLVIKTDGCVGIGNTNPGYRLTVNGTGYFGNLLTVSTGSSHGGIKMGNTYVTSIDGSVIFQNNTAIRFGTDSWDWNCWAGLKYDHGSKYIYLGLADGSVFSANSSQSGGRILTPGISYFHVGNQTSYYFANNGNIYGHEIYSDAWFRSYNACGWYNESHGCHIRPNTTGSYGSIRVHGGEKGGYEGIHFGSGKNGMTVMSIDGSHQGLYQESTGTWIIYNLNGNIGLGTSGLTSGYKVTVGGATYVKGALATNSYLASANYGTSAPGSSTAGSGVAGAIYFQII